MGEPFWDHVLADKRVGLLALAAAACAGPLPLNQAGYLDLAGGLFKTGGPLRFAAVWVGERLNLSD